MTSDKELRSHLKSCIAAGCPHSIRYEDIFLKDKFARGAVTPEDIDHLASSILGEFFATFPHEVNNDDVTKIRGYIRDQITAITDRSPAKSRAEVQARIDEESDRLTRENGHLATLTRGWLEALEWVLGRPE